MPGLICGSLQPDCKVFGKRLLRAHKGPTRPTPTSSRAWPCPIQLSTQPQHPGVAHYLIHLHDYPPIAEKGFEAASRRSSRSYVDRDERARCRCAHSGKACRSARPILLPFAFIIGRTAFRTGALHALCPSNAGPLRVGSSKVHSGQGADLLETRVWDALSDRVASYSASRSFRTAAI